jgi:arylsulfate sulfotransferase
VAVNSYSILKSSSARNRFLARWLSFATAIAWRSGRLNRNLALILPLLLCFTTEPLGATQADDTTIIIAAQTAGSTPFISQVTLVLSDTTFLKSIQFTIAPAAGSVTRPLAGTYSRDFLVSKGYLLPPNKDIFLPVYGLYKNSTNTVTLTYNFFDGSSKEGSIQIATADFDDPCGYDNPTVLQTRTTSQALSYDYIMIRAACSNFSPAVIDTDGALRWTGPGGFSSPHSILFENAFYIGNGTALYKIDFDGTASFLHDYSDIGVISFHHNIDRGKTGLILDVNTTSAMESVNLEVDAGGNVLKTWDMVQIISDAMLAGGDDPSQFVVPSSDDWFHNNAVTYNRADDSVVFSSRENFLICLDYESNAIKWILGDPTKAWHQYPSLAKYALIVTPGSLPPIGQHAVSITYDQHVMVFDNGKDSDIHVPVGEMRTYASPRKYLINLTEKTATEVWNYEMDQTIRDGICSGVYEDAPYNYLIDYADVNGPGAPVQYAQLLGLDAAEEKVFYYQYPTTFCSTAFNVLPLHLEKTAFPAVGPQPLNLSTRGLIGSGDDSLIGGFIVTGTGAKKVALRALGPSLAGSGISNPLADPAFTVYDSSGVAIAGNDDWQSDPAAAELISNKLAPANSAEAATVVTLNPAAYTLVVNGKDAVSGIGLVEIYDLSPSIASSLANISTRGFVGTGDNLLISGFILGDVDSTSVIIRGLGPSLSSAGVNNTLADPKLTVYDVNGSVLAENDNWQDDISASAIEARDLAPSDDGESATALFLPAGAYTAIMSGGNEQTGIGLVEIYSLN